MNKRELDSRENAVRIINFLIIFSSFIIHYKIVKFKEIAKNIDPRAFIAIENVYEVEGVRVKKRKI